MGRNKEIPCETSKETRRNKQNHQSKKDNFLEILETLARKLKADTEDKFKVLYNRPP